MANPGDLYSANFPWLLRAAGIELQPWDKTKFTWLSQISILKMMILPKFFYFYCIPPPGEDTQVLFPIGTSCIFRFRMISYLLICHTKNIRGLGLPNLFSFYQANSLMRIINWNQHVQEKLWVPLDKVLAG